MRINRFERSSSGISHDKKEVQQFITELKNADAVIVGAGAGLSTAAGFVYTGPRFQEYFRDFIEKYHFQDMYSGGFYPFKTLEEHWVYWSRYIYINRFMEAPKPVYNQLFDLIKEKDYFVITTNVDHCFQKAGVEKERLFYTQGDFGLWQCSKPCHAQTYENEETIYRMVKEQKEMRVPSELVPYCPRCHAPMSMNLRADHTFVEDEGWHKACQRYEDYLTQHQKARVLLLELGCGMNTPGIIKIPFWKLTRKYENFRYVCINKGEAWAPEEIWTRSLCINRDIADVLQEISFQAGGTEELK
ncbi:Sir2 silent information regulator family NAD-dependent deacetylase [Faecalicatena sp. AGMB00832]|uniref:protein acetyllysine N-acetyltransferase n=1 Tax=Faecalicatena faecalis TaxID=2726362 RepID=A0ABS6D9C9_9FIRM|nr:Sir2 family NAD-dependent protein deacetylase [Faecalicatena faecalis]MBU3877721.1 Sir2 silent information regulator family NAD-dependent deacetylase [Faecalicatena faecalis]